MVPLNVFGNFGCQRLLEHPLRAFTREVIQGEVQLLDLSVSASLTAFSMGGVSLSSGRQTGCMCDCWSRGRIRRLFHPLNCRSTTFENYSTAESEFH
jgi:hypothetical protein